MLTRRETILGGALTLIWGNCACAQAGASPHGFGCMLDAEQAAPYLASAAEPVASDQTFEKLFSSSGNRAFDYALAHTLSQLTDMFGVLPGFTFFDDDKQPNAYATAETKLRRADGTVLFGKRYFDRAMKEAESPEVHVLATCAHEFGHIVQNKYKVRNRLTAGQPTVKRLELHADFLAGYFAGARKLQKPEFPAAVVAADRFAHGDFGTTDKDHHGTPSERAAACVRGFETAYRERRSFGDAIGIGVNYVERL